MPDALLRVLQDTWLLLARPENDFTWSSWKNAEDALREIDALIALVSKGKSPDRRQRAVLFAPTGPHSGSQHQHRLITQQIARVESN